MNAISKHRVKETHHLSGKFSFHIMNDMAENNKPGTAQIGAIRNAQNIHGGRLFFLKNYGFSGNQI